jgi:hypothetical protein
MRVLHSRQIRTFTAAGRWAWGPSTLSMSAADSFRAHTGSMCSAVWGLRWPQMKHGLGCFVTGDRHDRDDRAAPS